MQIFDCTGDHCPNPHIVLESTVYKIWAGEGVGKGQIGIELGMQEKIFSNLL